MNPLIFRAFFTFGLTLGAASFAKADTPSLNDALSVLCKAPLWVDYSGANAILSNDGKTHIAVKDWAPYNKKKPTFLFLHGYPHGQGVWLAQLPLASKYRLVTMDRRGSGFSDAPAVGNYEDTDYSADIQAVIDRLGLKNVVLVTHSYGGIDLNSYIKNHPSGLSPIIGIVNVSSVMDLVNITISPSGEALIVATLTPDSSDPSKPSLQTTTDFVNASHYQPFPQLLSDAFIAMDMQTSLMARLGQLSSGTAHSDLSPYTARINVPVLLIVGQQDVIVSPANTTWWQTHLPSSPRIQRLDLPNVGHIPQLEAPIIFNLALDAFAGSL